MLWCIAQRAWCCAQFGWGYGPQFGWYAAQFGHGCGSNLLVYTSIQLVGS